MSEPLSVLQIGILDMVKAAIERFHHLFPGRTAKFFYAPEHMLHMIARALLEAGVELPKGNEVVSVFGVQLAYNDTNTIMVSDLTAKEINADLILQNWETEGKTKQ